MKLFSKQTLIDEFIRNFIFHITFGDMQPSTWFLLQTKIQTFLKNNEIGDLKGCEDAKRVEAYFSTPGLLKQFMSRMSQTTKKE